MRQEFTIHFRCNRAPSIKNKHQCLPSLFAFSIQISIIIAASRYIQTWIRLMDIPHQVFFSIPLFTCLLLCSVGVHMLLHTRRGQRTALWSQFSPFTFKGILGLELGSPGLISKHLYSPSHLSNSQQTFDNHTIYQQICTSQPLELPGRLCSFYILPFLCSN